LLLAGAKVNIKFIRTSLFEKKNLKLFLASIMEQLYIGFIFLFFLNGSDETR
jgi:formate/nitrite transporter FocA (FNT family)